MGNDGKEYRRIEFQRPSTTGPNSRPVTVGLMGQGRTTAERIRAVKKLYPDGYNFKEK